MKKLIWLFLFWTSIVLGADIKISQLPLGTASSTGVNDSFPYVVSSTLVTKRMTIWDLINVPTMVSTYAPKASPTFTGVVTSPSFVGALTGNASTATALAANPTDCGSNTYATTIAANGNLTCASITNASTTAVSTNTASTIVLRDGSGNFVAGTITAALTGNASTATALASDPSDCSANNYATAIAASGNLTCAQVSLSAGVTGTLPVGNGGTGITSGTQYGLPYFTTTGLMASTAAGTSVQLLHGNASGAATWSQASLTADVTGTLPIANGGTNSTATATAGGLGYGTGTAHAYTAVGTEGQFAGSAAAGVPGFRNFIPPDIQIVTATGTGTYVIGYAFVITSGSATAAATYTNNAVTFTVLRTVASGTLVYMSATGDPATSGTLTKASGTGDSTLTFSYYSKPKYLHVRMVGGGGGGAGSGTAGGTPGADSGLVSYFRVGASPDLLVANGGGVVAWSSAVGGAGGTATVSAPAYGTAITGGKGQGSGLTAVNQVYEVGGQGGGTPLGSGGTSGANTTGAAPAANTGAGGGGGGAPNSASVMYAGSGGGGGGFVDAIIPTPTNSYAYSVGTGGGGEGRSVVGTGGTAGGSGANGYIEVTGYYQ